MTDQVEKSGGEAMKQKSEGGQIWRWFKTEATMYPPFCFTPPLIRFFHQICDIPSSMPLDPLIPSFCSLPDPLFPPFCYPHFCFKPHLFVSPPPPPPTPNSFHRICHIPPPIVPLFIVPLAGFFLPPAIVSSLKCSVPSPIYALHKARGLESIKFVGRGKGLSYLVKQRRIFIRV